MDELSNTHKKDLISLLHGENPLSMPKPFQRDIFLFDTHVAGTTHIEGILELEKYLEINSSLSFYREPENPHDHEAIKITDSKGVKIGYIPRADNIIFARLMDAGKVLFGKITKKEVKGNWVKIDIGVYLHE